MLFFIVAISATLFSCPAAEQSWTRLTGCTLLDNAANDGDSFHVSYQGKEFIFRLYFVDACETSDQVPARVKEQAAELSLDEARVLQAGHAASALTKRELGRAPFTIVTRWQDAMGASRLPRSYAFVLYGPDDGHDLASTLARAGMVRVYGMPAEPPGPMSAGEFRDSLLRLAAAAKAGRLGVYGDLSAGAPAPAAAGKAGGRATGASVPSTALPLSYLFPSKSKAPEVVENPADDIVADFAVESAGTGVIVTSGIPEDDYSEIPGWQPPAKKKKKPREKPADATAPDEIPD